MFAGLLLAGLVSGCAGVAIGTVALKPSTPRDQHPQRLSSETDAELKRRLGLSPNANMRDVLEWVDKTVGVSPSTHTSSPANQPRIPPMPPIPAVPPRQ